jgi:hypothetical protein
VALNTAYYRGNGVTALDTADAAVTISGLTSTAAVVKTDPYTGTEYGSNKVWSLAQSGTARTTAADAIANNVYTEWTVTRTGGLLPKSVRIKAARGALGSTVRGFRVRSSIDGYATDLLGRDLALVAAETRPNLVQFPAAGDTATGDLSAAPQQTSVTFRLYNYVGTTSQTIEFDDFEFTFDTPSAGVPARPFYLGATRVDAAYAGSAAVGAVYLGATQVWQG